MRCGFWILIWFCPFLLYGQNQIPIYGWEELFSLRQTIDVTQNDQTVFFATQNGIVAIDKISKEKNNLTKVNALSNSDIAKITYYNDGQELIVLYSDGSFDIIDSTSTYTVTDIAQNTTILKSKVCYNTYINDDKLFLAMDFGIVEYNLTLREFGTTFFSDSPIYHITKKDDKLWATTDTAFLFIDASKNFADPKFWSSVPTENFIESSGNLAIWQNQLLFPLANQITIINESGLTPLASYENFSCQNLKADGDFLYALENCFRCGLGLKKIAPNLSNVSINTECLKEAQDFIVSKDGTAWFVSSEPGYAYTASGEKCDLLDSNRPIQNAAFSLLLDGDKKILPLGGVLENYNNTFSTRGFEYYDGADWLWYSAETNDFLRENDIRDILKVVKDPIEDRYYFASFWSGVVEWDGQNFLLFNDENSTLTHSIYDERVRVSDLDFDDSGNLWCTTYFSEKNIAVKTPSGDWYSINCPYGSDLIKVIAQGDLIYFVLKEQGLVVYNPGETLESTSDDKWVKIRPSEEGIPSTTIYDLALDKDDNVWVGTNQGAAYIYCDNDLECFTERPIVEPKYLLFNEQVRAIAIDGANRKWFGTNNGIYLQDEFIDDELFHFTESNSPLVDQKIVDLQIDPNSGLVYTLTNSGIMAFRSDATEGKSVHESEIYAFPNPVKPDYHGPIAIKGLSSNAYVKIMDIVGNLIYEGRANGGQFIWNGMDQDGNRIGSGTYYAFSYNTSSFSGKDGGKVPILIIR